MRSYEPLQWIVGTGVYIDDIEAVVARKTEHLNGQLTSLVIKISIITIGISLLTLLGLWLVAHHISAPFIKCTDFARELGDGNLQAEIDICGEDEIGQLACSMQEMGGKLKESLYSIRSVAATLAEGATSQAASLEETSASLEQMSAMTRQSAENARQGSLLLGDTRDTVAGANSAMQELEAFMEKIAQASQETQLIVKTIDEIAFQTNLLALNAAVEAARAGEAGAGFAVVADEVRNLAMRAAAAAKNTAELIEATVKQIGDGGALTSATGEKFSSVNDKVDKLNSLFSEVSQAANDQAIGIDQLNSTVSSINQVVQETVDNAQRLVAAMSVFHTGDGQSNRRAARQLPPA